MKIHSLMLLVLMLVSGSVSATIIDYSLSGNLNLSNCSDPTFDPKCGEFSVMFSIDDTQTPTDDGGGWFSYIFNDVMATLADGTVLDNGAMSARTNAGIEQGVKFTLYTGGGETLLNLAWLFPDSTFDITDIGGILNALQNGPVTSSLSQLDSNYDPGGCFSFSGDCAGTVGLIEPNPVPEPATLALLSLGLAGLGFTRRMTKA